MKLPRFVRLLPVTVLLGVALLVTKGSGLVHEAYAQASEKVAALTNDPVPANADYAGGEDDQIASASQVDVVNALARRRKELDAREAVLNTQANMIAAAEQRVDAKISQLKQLQAQINALLVQRDKLQQDQIDSLVKTYSTMKAKDAARIFNNLPDDVLIPVAHDMKSDILAQVLANMNADNAKTLTVKLAGKLTLPQTADAVAPPPTLVAPVQAADAAPAPMQVASIPTTAPAAAAQPAAAPAAPAAKPRRRAAAPAADQAAATPPAKAPGTAPAATAASATPAAAPAAATTPETAAKPKG
jgi:flagellar motility protein MotE (MotC chaperone)